MSYGQCEYHWHRHFPNEDRTELVRCTKPATVIVAGPAPGENPERLCSDHEAVVANESFDQEVEDFANKTAEQVFQALKDRLAVVEARIKVLETKQAMRIEELRLKDIIRKAQIEALEKKTQ